MCGCPWGETVTAASAASPIAAALTGGDNSEAAENGVHSRSSLCHDSAMPSTTIDVRKRWSDEDEVAIIDAVHASLVAAFRIPENDKHVRFIGHLPHRLAHPPSLTQPELMTLITIDCFEGRSVDAKRDLYRNIVERLEELGIPRNHVTITVRDLPRENWGIRGGQAANDLDLGFNVRV